MLTYQGAEHRVSASAAVDDGFLAARLVPELSPSAMGNSVALPSEVKLAYDAKQRSATTDEVAPDLIASSTVLVLTATASSVPPQEGDRWRGVDVQTIKRTVRRGQVIRWTCIVGQAS